ncbi:hypothetical protein BGAL_0161g00130 [Botrytis galanthina]|uniref:Uncharacterized protein n=1 Tax=Botrytis galanthina TaxID=278940 RepID=A0A4S8R7F1_9HELO|nr:hypothetical protein BGAL_0161g00130 [Botrytis galanthina]
MLGRVLDSSLIAVEIAGQQVKAGCRANPKRNLQQYEEQSRMTQASSELYNRKYLYPHGRRRVPGTILVDQSNAPFGRDQPPQAFHIIHLPSHNPKS